MIETYYGVLSHDHTTKEIMFLNIFEDRRSTEMCCSDPDRIRTLQVRKALPGEKSDYWGWLRPNANTYTMIYPALTLLEMCFPYGIEAEERKGTGKRVNLVVTEEPPV